MRFVTFSRREAEQWNPIGQPHVIISITTPGDPPAAVRTNEHTLEVLRLSFHDLDQEPGPAYRKVYGEPVLFNECDAKLILAFMATHHDLLDTVLVHCDAGHSRSTAVAAALAYCYNEREQSNWFFQHRSPNRHIYRMLLAAMADEGTRKL